jgi:hypothetical protein
MPEDRKFSKAFMMVKNDKIICEGCQSDADKPVMNSENRISKYKLKKFYVKNV